MAGRSSIIDANVGLTFDDVLLLPGRSEVLPGETDVASRVTKDEAKAAPTPATPVPPQQ